MKDKHQPMYDLLRWASTVHCLPLLHDASFGEGTRFSVGVHAIQENSKGTWNPVFPVRGKLAMSEREALKALLMSVFEAEIDDMLDEWEADPSATAKRLLAFGDRK